MLMNIRKSGLVGAFIFIFMDENYSACVETSVPFNYIVGLEIYVLFVVLSW